jgi:hypothetical protein
MPAYTQHYEADSAFVACPSCLDLHMFVRDVEPHWSMSKIDFIYQCFDCGAEISKTMIKPEPAH